MTKFLHRLGVSAARRPWRMLGIWLLVALAVFGARSAWGSDPVDRWTIPGSDSQKSADRLEEHFPEARASTARIVFHNEEGLGTPERQAAAQDVLAAASEAEHVVVVTDPFDPATLAVSADGQTAFSTVTFDNGDG